MSLILVLLNLKICDSNSTNNNLTYTSRKAVLYGCSEFLFKTLMPASEIVNFSSPLGSFFGKVFNKHPKHRHSIPSPTSLSVSFQQWHHFPLGSSSLLASVSRLEAYVEKFSIWWSSHNARTAQSIHSRPNVMYVRILNNNVYSYVRTVYTLVFEALSNIRWSRMLSAVYFTNLKQLSL